MDCATRNWMESIEWQEKKNAKNAIKKHDGISGMASITRENIAKWGQTLFRHWMTFYL